MITQEQLKEIGVRVDALKRYLDIDSKKIQVEEEELRTQVPDFWNDQKAAELQMRKIKELRFWIENYEALAKQYEELQLAFDFVKDELVTEEEVAPAAPSRRTGHPCSCVCTCDGPRNMATRLQ